MMPKPRIAVIGGSGLYHMESLSDVKEILIDTPFGSPSDVLLCGKLEGIEVAFLARHGRHHSYLPSEIPYQANIYALKSLGVEYIVSVSAVGSLQEGIHPLDIVIPDQFIDRTKDRPATYFGDGLVAHIAFGQPLCSRLIQLLVNAVESIDLGCIQLHQGKTYVCIEGPAFSTKAESEIYRSWGCSVIGMTNLTEAKLAREAEIAYATLAMVTDYDCWHSSHESVTVEMVLQNLSKNADNAQLIVQEVIRKIASIWPVSEAHSALKDALVTPIEYVPESTKNKLECLIDKYF
jgi:5'-methylthioadenosine phosphorylase